MSSDRVAVVARRGALAMLGGIAAILAGGRADAKSAGRDRPKMRAVEDEYRRLLSLWQTERRRFAMSSDTHDSWKGPHGKAIIALGPAIIPYLIQELRKGDFVFNVPLALITKVDITNGAYTSEQASSQLWLAWWDGAKP